MCAIQAMTYVSIDAMLWAFWAFASIVVSGNICDADTTELMNLMCV